MTLEEYGRKLYEIHEEIEAQLMTMDDTTEEYKDLQYFNDLIDVVWGSSTLNSEGYEVRQKDLEAVQDLINRMEVME